jgi:hypothetical protein
VIYKGTGGARTRAGLLDPGDADRLARLGTCPVYLQRYIPGDNVRVHVVDMEVFATEIVSDAIDYRARVRQMTSVVLPAEVADRCVAVTQTLGLLLAGLELIRTPRLLAIMIVTGIPPGGYRSRSWPGGHRSLQELTAPWGSGTVSLAWPPVMRVAIR